MSLLSSVKLPSESLVGGESSLSGTSGAFFYNQTSLYAYARIVGPEADGVNNALWSFNTADDTWRLVQIHKISFGNNSDGVYASDPRTGTSFYTGGCTMAFNGTNNGTVKFQSSNSDSPQWAFETVMDGIQGPDILKALVCHDMIC